MHPMLIPLVFASSLAVAESGAVFLVIISVLALLRSRSKA